MSGHNSERIATLARWTLSLAFVVGIALPLASLQPFRLGYWDRAEPLVVGLQLCAALAALGMALAACRADGRATAAFWTPTALISLALGGYSLLMAPLMPEPLLSALGAPQSGQGGIWYLEFGLLIAAARYLRTDGAWAALQRMAIVSVAIVAAIKAFDWYWEIRGGEHLLIWVAAYYAWLGLALPVFTDDAGSLWRKLSWAAAIAVILAGRSITAAAAAALAVALMAGMPRINRPAWEEKATPFLPLLVLVAIPIGLLSVPALSASASLADRRSLLMMVKAAISSWSPTTWITGIGWGRTQDTFHANLGQSGQVLWDNSWIFMTSDYFHSHSALVEAMLAAGVPGLVLTAAWFTAIPAGADRGKRAMATAFAIGLAALSSLWFQLSLSLPLMALALAALTPPLPTPPNRQPRLGWCSGAVLSFAAALGCSALAFHLYSHGRKVEAVRSDLLGAVNNPRAFPSGRGGDDLIAAEIIRDAFWELEAARTDDSRAKALPAVRLMAAHLLKRIPVTDTMLMLTTGISLQDRVHISPNLKWLDSNTPEQEMLWGRWLDRALTLAPGRTDLAIPYLTHLAVAGRTDELRTRAARIIAASPRDPVGLYFQGLLTVQSPDPAIKRQGLDILRASVTAGIERLMPLDPSLRALLQ